MLVHLPRQEAAIEDPEEVAAGARKVLALGAVTARVDAPAGWTGSDRSMSQLASDIVNPTSSQAPKRTHLV